MAEEVKEKVEEVQEKKEIKISERVSKIIDTIAEMSVLECSQMVKALEEKFGVSAAQPMVAAAMAAPAAAAQEEEKTSFTVVLTSSGDKKIQVIKEIRAITSLGLKEAKDLVDGAPKTVKEDLPKEEAEAIKKKLEEAGATVELK
ncbi:MAG: 50S ribosomal protein L7/L12 [Candidatus Omnitrophota bacterium]